MDAVPSPEVVADGDVSGTDDMPFLIPSGWSTPDLTEEKAFTRRGVDPAKYFKVMDPTGIKYACSRCGVVFPGLHELDTHWLRNHGRAVANWTTLGKIFPAHTAFLRIRPILEAHQASLRSHHFVDTQRDVRTWSSENISCGSFEAAQCSGISGPCTWNSFGRPSTLFPEMLLDNLDRSLRESRASFDPVNPLDLSQSCLPLEPSHNVLTSLQT
ncbi:uncharacterized protein LOC112568792 [Pomacea canaliculata]|uniref:uncharacterized protein LOC112568792 n=1 Tax=Pomacea canaliculata TaxID=400727 RepID=UPI000D72F49E|nr:uncharacterized protein LOC112568792 [Pomacea canaliculata]